MVPSYTNVMTYDFGKKYFSNEQIIEYVNSPRMHTTILSFLDDDGYILTCPVWSLFYGEYFYFSTDDFSRKFKSILKGKKISLSIIEPDSYPNGRPGVIPYFSVSGTARVRRKEDFTDYAKVIELLYEKFDKGFANQDAKEQWISTLMDNKHRVLIELPPERVIVYQAIERAVEEFYKKQG